MKKTMDLTQKILRNYKTQIDKLSKRLLTAEMRVSELENEQLWQKQDQGWQQESFEELEKKVERLQQSINTVELEQMIFDPKS